MRLTQMLDNIKNLILSVIFALCIYVVFGGYFYAMMSGNLPGQKNNEPAEMCAVFSDGESYSMAYPKSIKKYARVTGLKYKRVECK